MSDDELDDLVDRWHDLAALDRHSLTAVFGSDSIALLRSIVQSVLGQPVFLEPQDAGQFSDFVLQLRDSEREWSRKLGDSIVRAAHLSEEGEKTDAAKHLADFICSCPWRTFRGFAGIEQEEYL